MALEISTVGASVKYCVASSASRPTSSYTVIADVSSAPDITLEVEALDASNISDTITRYIAGRQDPGGSKEITLNHTESAITAWESLVTAAETARAAGKETWFEYAFPNASKSFFFSAIPLQLGTNGIEQNAVDTLTAPLIVTGVAGWQAKSTT